MSIIALAAAAALAFQPPSSEPKDEATVSGVVITAPSKVKEQEAIRSFVEEVAAPSGNGRIGRWDRKICPGFLGVKNVYGQYIMDRIAKTALEVGLEVGEPGCKANVLIVFTADSDAFVRTVMKERDDIFSKYDLDMTAGRKALEVFQTTDAPVRWWHVTGRVTADGQRYEQGGSVTVRGVSRLKSETRTDFDRAIVIVDASRVRQVRFEALADYLTFVSLAQIDPDAAPSMADSVLNLFGDKAAGREPQQRMTEWDIAYLKGLYSARRDTKNAKGQKKDIAGEMDKTLGGQHRNAPDE